jgi:hypothetical protein
MAALCWRDEEELGSLFCASNVIKMTKRLVIIFFSLRLLAAAQSATSSSGTQSPGDESTAKAKSLINLAIQALGGNAYLNMSDSSSEGRTYSFHHGQSTSTGLIYFRDTRYPDKERIDLTKKRDVSYVYVGDHGYEVTYKGTAMLDPKVLAEYIRRRRYSLEWVLRRWINEPGVALFYDGSAIAEQKQTDQVTIMNAQNEAVTLYLDPDTHLPVKKRYQWRDPADREKDVEDEVYDNYKPVQGVMTPYSVTRYYNGDMSNQRFINAISYNQGVDEAKFAVNATYDPNRVPSPPPPKK